MSHKDRRVCPFKRGQLEYEFSSDPFRLLYGISSEIFESLCPAVAG